jgi:phage repressor protein C with HTH and peptisase S24 domain
MATHMNKTFNTFFERVSESLGITSLTELADILKVNRSSITQARKKDSVPANWLLELFRRYGLNPDWLEGGNGPHFLKPDDDSDTVFFPVPKVQARLCAGAGSFEVDSRIEGYYSFQKKWLQFKGAAERMVLMDVFGNSMTPEIKDGDTVLIDQSQKDIFAGTIYAVGIEDTIMVKRLEKHPHKLVLLSDNKEYAPIFLTDEESGSVRIIGKVLWICRELR